MTAAAVNDMAASVTKMISSDKVVVFSKTTCPYCSQVKDLFADMDCKFAVFELDKINDGGAIQDYLGNLTGARTVPRVFVNGKCIGGASDTKKLHDSGKLKTLI